MGDPWGIGVFRGGEKPNIKQIVKKKKKNGQKIGKIGRIRFFLLGQKYIKKRVATSVSCIQFTAH